MKTNWPTKKLGEVCDILDNLRKPVTRRDRKPGPYPYYGATGVQDYVADFIFDEDLVLVGEDGARWNAGDNSAYKISGKSWVNNHAHVLRPHRNILLDDWLVYFLNISDLSEYITGTTVKKLNQAKLRSIEIPLPPLSEQKKIVAKLERVLGKINSAKKLREEAESASAALLPAELHKIFEEGKKKGWEKKELGEIFVLNYGKGLSRLERSENGKYIVYGANGELGRSDNYLIEGNGLIIGRKGSAGEITRASGRYWPTDVTYFVTEDKKYDISFAYFLFKFLNFPQYAVGVKPGINRNQIYEIKISLPPLAEQKKIVARLNSLSEKIRQLQECQKSTQSDFLTLEQSVLSKSFNYK